MEEAGVKFSKTKIEKAVDLHNEFAMWLSTKTGHGLKEMKIMEEVMSVLGTEMFHQALQRQVEGKELTSQDLKVIGLLMNAAESSHKLKHGEKHVNVNFSYKDIQDKMFEDANSTSK